MLLISLPLFIAFNHFGSEKFIFWVPIHDSSFNYCENFSWIDSRSQ